MHNCTYIHTINNSRTKVKLNFIYEISLKGTITLVQLKSKMEKDTDRRDISVIFMYINVTPIRENNSLNVYILIVVFFLFGNHRVFLCYKCP